VPIVAPISAAVEGLLDDAVLRSLVEHIGGAVGTVFGKRGKDHLRARAPAYNAAAVRYPWVLLVDLDDAAACPPLLVSSWLPVRSARLCFRVAVHKIEAWLLADRGGLARFLGVQASKLPADPDSVPDPKQEIVNLARKSRLRAVREDIVPPPGSRQTIGQAYNAKLVEFVRGPGRRWDIDKAASRSTSLGRSLAAMRGLIRAAR